MDMDIHTNIPLKNITTMKLGGPARFFAEAHTPQEVQALYQNAASKNVPVFILGGGSNVLAHDEGFDGLVIRLKIPGFEVVADDLNTTTIRIGAGENWDETVRRTVEMRLSGIEALSGIPGTAGAAPVQNIGAYGQEVADTLISLEAYDTTTNGFVTLSSEACGFAYRHSIFRGDQQGRYIITSITLHLSKNLPMPPFYDSLQTYFDAHSITIFTHQSVRDAVLAIRSDKLPDPTIRPNSGSFFKNAIIDSWRLDDLTAAFPDIKTYQMGNGSIKIPTGWLIEKTGLKGALLHGMRVNDKNALVLINESATSYADLAAAREEIIGKVRDMFQIMIEQEPLEITNDLARSA
jgi:UDP-N-acetylmuramate dehydrogenase